MCLLYKLCHTGCLFYLGNSLLDQNLVNTAWTKSNRSRRRNKQFGRNNDHLTEVPIVVCSSKIFLSVSPLMRPFILYWVKYYWTLEYKKDGQKLENQTTMMYDGSKHLYLGRSKFCLINGGSFHLGVVKFFGFREDL